MNKLWRAIAAPVVLLACFSGVAAACSCPGTELAGFIHADVIRLPANARGALFLPPRSKLEPVARVAPAIMLYQGEVGTLSAASFEITSDTDARSLQPVLTWPDLGRDGGQPAPGRAFRFLRSEVDAERAHKLKQSDVERMLRSGVLVEITAQLADAGRLVRIGPVGGFKPGSRYQVRFLGDPAGFAFPGKVEHVIDLQPLDTAVDFGLALDGPPSARLLPLATGSGSCGNLQPALVQDFHYRIPASYRPYLDALVFFSQSREGGANGFAAIRYRSASCGPDTFGRTALDEAKDIFHTSCSARPPTVAIRGWAGLLEVEDRLHPTQVEQVDTARAAGDACTGFGMLAQALAARDAPRVKAAVCALQSEGGEGDGEIRPSSAGAYPAGALITLAADDDAELRQCAVAALGRVLIESPAVSTRDLGRFVDVIKTELASGDPARIDAAGRSLAQDGYWIRDKRQRAEIRRRFHLLADRVTDAVVHTLLTQPSAATGMLPYVLGSFKTSARRHLPRLVAAAAENTESTPAVLNALEKIAPADPRFHAVLVLGAGKAGLGEPAALAFSRVAGRTHPGQAIALLMGVAAVDDSRVVYAMSEYGPPGRRARALLPAIALRTQRPMSSELKQAIVAAVKRMKLPAAQQRRWLANIEAAKEKG